MLLEARLRAFLALAEAGSFVEAAERLHLSHPRCPSTSRRWNGSRRCAGAPPPNVRADPARTVPRRLRRTGGALLEQADRGVRALVEAEGGTLRLGASGTPGTYVIPGVVRQFVGQRPFVEVDFRLGTSAETLAALRNHEIEIAVVGGLATHHEFSVEPLLDDQLVLVGAPALAEGPLWPGDLDGLLWVHREEGSATRVALDAALHAIGAAPRRRLALPSWEAIKLVVAQGDAVAAISRLAIAVEQAAGTLTELALEAGASADRSAWRGTPTYRSVRSPPPSPTNCVKPVRR